MDVLLVYVCVLPTIVLCAYIWPSGSPVINVITESCLGWSEIAPEPIRHANLQQLIKSPSWSLSAHPGILIWYFL